MGLPFRSGTLLAMPAHTRVIARAPSTEPSGTTRDGTWTFTPDSPTGDTCGGTRSGDSALTLYAESPRNGMGPHRCG